MATSLGPKPVQDPMEAYKQASPLTGRHTPQGAASAQAGQDRDILTLPGAPALSDQGPATPISTSTTSSSSSRPALRQQQPGGSPAPSPPQGFMGMTTGGSGASTAVAAAGSPERAAEMLEMQQSPTVEKMVRGILAIGDMSAASIAKTAQALGGALSNYAANAVAASPPLSQPLTVSKTYVARLSFIQMFTQPAAQGAQIIAQYAGEVMFWLLQMSLVVYHQLAAMKVLPQITTGGPTDTAGVPVNPVSGGLPVGRDELTTFKLVAAALLMAYVEVYDALEEAAQLLFRQAAAAGERYLAHRHGGEAADVASAALSVSMDLLTLTLNWFRLLGRGLVSKAATTSARTYLKEHVRDLHLA